VPTERKLRYTFNGRRSSGTKVEAVGFNGKGCEATIRSFAAKMGGEVHDVDYEPEYYNKETEKERDYE